MLECKWKIKQQKDEIEHLEREKFLIREQHVIRNMQPRVQKTDSEKPNDIINLVEHAYSQQRNPNFFNSPISTSNFNILSYFHLIYSNFTGSHESIQNPSSFVSHYIADDYRTDLM